MLLSTKYHAIFLGMWLCWVIFASSDHIFAQSCLDMAAMTVVAGVVGPATNGIPAAKVMVDSSEKDVTEDVAAVEVDAEFDIVLLDIDPHEPLHSATTFRELNLCVNTKELVKCHKIMWLLTTAC